MTLKEFYKINNKAINASISSALKEDKIKNDATTSLLLTSRKANIRKNALLLCKEDCILAGLEIFKRVYRQIDKKVTFKTFCKDGDRLKKGDKVMLVKTSFKNLLAGERTALNFLQRMSGIATYTNRFVQKLKYKNAKILHTRKTTPNLRVIEAAAVKTGGGDFHRFSLASSVLIKDNHIEALGGIKKLMAEISSKKIPPRLKQKFEIEVKTYDELLTVIKYGKKLVKVVMLDNFKPRDMGKAIRLLKRNGFKIEVSGGINLENFSRFQKKGIDFYSIGALTHSYKSADFSLDF